MQKVFKKVFQAILVYFLPLLGIYAFYRILFYLFNFSFLKGIPFRSLIIAFIHGLRFDISALTMLNGVFLLFFIFNWNNFKHVKKILIAIYVVLNSVALGLMAADLAYFPFTLKHSGYDLLAIKSDTVRLLPQFFIDYWYLFILWAFSCWSFIKLFKHLETKYLTETSTLFQSFFSLIFIAGLSALGIRGGLQLRPLDLINANEFNGTQASNLVINTPFNFIITATRPSIEKIEWISEKEINDNFKFNKTVNHPTPFSHLTKPNIVVIVLESFGAEYSAVYNPIKKSYMPFLDSLMQKGIFFDNAYANGRTSVDGITSIFLGIPALMSESFAFSPYQTNQTFSLGAFLNKEGYNTSFYHGGENGTMQLNNIIQKAGISNYYGKNQFPNSKDDYDGSWGIWDHKYFTYFKDELSNKSQPFYSSIFTLSSHHPFVIPSNFKNQFNEGELPIHKCISYTDFAIKSFFESAKNESWFSNTIFIFTADHTSQSNDEKFQTKSGLFKVPLFMWSKQQKTSVIISKVAQHIDILPTIVNLVNPKLEIKSFGNSLFSENKNHFAVQKNNGSFQAITQNKVIEISTSGAFSISNINTSMIETDLKSVDTLLYKAYFQEFTNRMLNNKLQ